MQGANQAAAAASLGYPTYFLGQVMWLVTVDCPLPLSLPTHNIVQSCTLNMTIHLLTFGLAGRHRR